MKKYLTLSLLAILIILAVIFLQEKPKEEKIESDSQKASNQEEQLTETPKENFSTYFVHDFQNAKPAMISEALVTILVTDFVEHNPKWLPGGPESFYLNAEKKKENLVITEATESYICGNGPDGNATSPDVRVELQKFTDHIRQYLNTSKEYAKKGYAGYTENPEYSASMIVSENQILAIYDQCLP